MIDPVSYFKSTDAAKWAEAFAERFAVFEKISETETVRFVGVDAKLLMVGWFANAINAGMDAGADLGYEAALEG